MRAILLVLSLITLPGAAQASYGACDSKGQPALGVVEVSLDGTPATTFYIDDRNYLFGNGLWIYQESTGDMMLERGGSSPYVPDDNEVCVGDPAITPDTLII